MFEIVSEIVYRGGCSKQFLERIRYDVVKFHGLFDTICGEVPKRLKGLASNTSRRVTPVRGFKSPSLRQLESRKAADINENVEISGFFSV